MVRLKGGDSKEPDQLPRNTGPTPAYHCLLHCVSQVLPKGILSTYRLLTLGMARMTPSRVPVSPALHSLWHQSWPRPAKSSFSVLEQGGV